MVVVGGEGRGTGDVGKSGCNRKMNISGVNMIELQNEQLANCPSFDEETFNYPPGGERSPIV